MTAWQAESTAAEGETGHHAGRAEPGGRAVLTGREIRLRRYPAGAPTAADFRIVRTTLRALEPGDVLVRNTFTSVDPSLLLRMRAGGTPGYFPPFPLDAPLDGIMTVGEVLESLADGFTAGDTVWHALGWREYAVVRAGAPALNGLGTLRKLDAELAPPHTYLGPLGAMGLTAYAGLFHAAELHDSDIVWVSAAAGGVGSLAAQFAKLTGHKVIGSAGSEAKVEYLLHELGLDAAFNHRSGSLHAHLATASPDGIDVYFDNVGGEHLEAALNALRPRGRVALCGAISEYVPTSSPRRPAGLFDAVAKDLTLRGFRGSTHVHLMADMQRTVAGWLAEGALRYRESIVDGLEHAPEALARLLAGDTIGKTLVRLDGSHASSAPALKSASISS